MSTYENAYKILSSVRLGLDEYSTAYVQGTDTTGAHDNLFLMDKINTAQRFIFNLLYKRMPHEFLTEVSLTPTSSVYTLPADFGSLIWFKDENGYQVYPVTVDRLKTTNATGSDRMYYRKANTLVLDKTGVSTAYTLYYKKKARDIHTGSASAGAATSITLSSTYASKIADHYNGMTIENITQDWVDTIDDYSAARVATISETAAASDYYGIVPDIPEMFHTLIAPKAILDVRLESPVVKRKSAKADKDNFWEMLIETLRAYAGSAQDIELDDIFGDGGNGSMPTGIIID